jgi:Domain of unknown function (DUF4382)
MKQFRPVKALFLFLMISLFITSCSKEEIKHSGEMSSVTVNLKSTIGELNNVFIDIKAVELRVKLEENAPNAWVNLETINQGTHNTSELEVQLILVNDFIINSTNIYEIRLVLGENNFINLNNVLHNLDIADLGNSKPSNLLDTELIANRFYDFVIDIDIDNSISFNEDENMMILDPQLYTEIRQYQY